MKKMIPFLIVVVTFILPLSKGFAYTIQPGDNLSRIALKHHTTVQKLLRNNPQISNANVIYAGDNLDTSYNKRTTGATAVSANDIDLLAKIVHAEASGEPFSGKVAVANVVLNRVESPRFPNTVHDVIYQPTQFSPVQDGSINDTPSRTDYKAVDVALSGNNQVPSSLYFYNPEISTNHSLDHLSTTKRIGNHVFKQ